MSKIREAIEFLQQDPANRYLNITNQDTGVVVGKTNLYLGEIPNQDLEAYIRFNVGNVVSPMLVWVEHRKKQGNTYVKAGSGKIQINPNVAELPNNLPQPYNPEPIQAKPIAENNFFGQNFGLGVVDVIDMKLNKEKLEHKNEVLRELKEDFTKLKQDFNLQEVENRQLKADLSTAKAKEDIAVMMVKLENKSFFDSPAFEKIMENAPAMLGTFAQMKSGAAVAGALGSPVSSDAKKEFFDYANEHLSDEQINYLGSVCHFLPNPNFTNQLNLLIQQTNATK